MKRDLLAMVDELPSPSIISIASIQHQGLCLAFNATFSISNETTRASVKANLARTLSSESVDDSGKNGNELDSSEVIEVGSGACTFFSSSHCRVFDLGYPPPPVQVMFSWQLHPPRFST